MMFSSMSVFVAHMSYDLTTCFLDTVQLQPCIGLDRRDDATFASRSQLWQCFCHQGHNVNEPVMNAALTPGYGDCMYLSNGPSGF